MTQFPNIPDSVKEDIRKRAEERYPIFPATNADFNLIERKTYRLALCEAWEMMGRAWDAALFHHQYGVYSPTVPNKTEFLNQIFKR